MPDLTWRKLLGKITSDPHEQQRVLETLDINAMTLRRWVNGTTNPRSHNFRLLLNVFPQHRKQLSELLLEEFPSLDFEQKGLIEEEIQIPSRFYAQVMNMYVGIAQHIRSSTISAFILEQMLKQLDPAGEGMFIIVAQCVPPGHDQPVRSLRAVVGRGTPPWSTYTEYHPQFFGAESLVGEAVSSGHPIVICSSEELRQHFSFDVVDGVQSVVSAPIVVANRTVGGLYVASMLEDYFSPSFQNLIQQYIELMGLAFEEDEFYPFSQISFGVMPPSHKQIPYITSFQRYVTTAILNAARSGFPITRFQAERIAWQRLEQELMFGSAS